MPNSSTLSVTAETLRELTAVLERYRAGKSHTEQRIIASEGWWKLRNSAQEQLSAHPEDFRSVSGWLHNVIVSKHADAMDAFPEPVILPREPSDRDEARRLTDLIPCVLEQNDFEQVYSDVMWQKLKSGTGVYKVVWDPHKLGGLGDISIQRVSLLNLFWEPGITDIQHSRYLFHTELVDKDILRRKYPALTGRLKSQPFLSARYLADDPVDVSDKATVIECYYRKAGVLHYVRYVEDVVLFATENHPTMAETGLYDHGRFPYVFDTLFPVEGSPCGYGFVDLCRNPQMEIDLLKTAFVKNAMVGATPRYFSRGDGGVNEAEFLDLSRPIVHVTTSTAEDFLRPIATPGLDGTYVSVLDRTIQELRETTGNTETATGTVSSGVTAASAIAALQEASGKGSRDATRSAYRAYAQIVELCIELIRQFYTLPRQFRITGPMGQEQFVSYDNAALRPVPQGTLLGRELGMRLPVFDVRISAQKKNAYTRMANNELALQLYQLGLLDPKNAQAALMVLDMMEFDGKQGLMQRVARNGLLYGQVMQPTSPPVRLTQTPGEDPRVTQARAKAQNAPQPGE